MMAGAWACAFAGVAASAGTVNGWASSADGLRKLAPMPAITLLHGGRPADGENEVVIKPVRRFQTMIGFGAAMTDASAQILMHRMTPVARANLLGELFGRRGLALNILRVPIGASDFSTHHYTFDDMPAGQSDPALAAFSMAPAQEAQIPALKAARRVNPGLVLMASPWSAPAWMKSNDSLIGGHLRPGSYASFARYLLRYLQAMRSTGLGVDWLSIQNEPDFEPADYPGMKMTAPERAAVIRDDLGPLLAAHKSPTRLLDWDHNWDKPENPQAVLADARASRYIAGIAWHCYAGDASAMAAVHAAHPDTMLMLTECSGGDWAADWGKTLGWMTDNLIIAATRAGSRGTMLWNLALDETHGPHKGGCTDCRGVVTVNSRDAAITRNLEYYALGHASRFVRPGAWVIASNQTAAITDVAFINRDGSRVLLAHNGSGGAARLLVRDGARSFRVSLPVGEIATFVWRAPFRYSPSNRFAMARTSSAMSGRSSAKASVASTKPVLLPQS